MYRPSRPNIPLISNDLTPTGSTPPPRSPPPAPPQRIFVPMIRTNRISLNGYHGHRPSPSTRLPILPRTNVFIFMGQPRPFHWTDLLVPRHSKPKPKIAIKPELLASIIANRTLKKHSILLIDCRDSEKFQEKRIKFPNCVNIPVKPDVVFSEGFTPSTNVIKFLQEHYPALLGYMNAPGYFGQIVLYDDHSNPDNFAQPLKAIFNAVDTWNEAKKTRVTILDGGMDAWVGEDLIVRGSDTVLMKASRISEKSFGGNLEATVEGTFHLPPTPTPINIESMEMNMKLHIKNLDDAIEAALVLINYRGYLQSITQIKQVLFKNKVIEINRDLEIMIPVDVKCPVCKKIFAEPIYKCTNGHNICSECSFGLNNCPKCGTSYGFGCLRIRDKDFEKILMESGEIWCRGCDGIFSYGQVKYHGKMCPSTFTPEVEKIEVQSAVIERNEETFWEKHSYLSSNIFYGEHNLNQELDKGQFEENIAQKIQEKSCILSGLNSALFSNLDSMPEILEILKKLSEMKWT